MRHGRCRRLLLFLLLLQTQPAFKRRLVGLQLVAAAADADVAADGGLHERVEGDGLRLVPAGPGHDVLGVEPELFDELLQRRFCWRRCLRGTGWRHRFLPGPQPGQDNRVVCVRKSLCVDCGFVSEAGQAGLLLWHERGNLSPLRDGHGVGVQRDSGWCWRPCRRGHRRGHRQRPCKVSGQGRQNMREGRRT